MAIVSRKAGLLLNARGVKKSWSAATSTDFSSGPMGGNDRVREPLSAFSMEMMELTAADHNSRMKQHSVLHYDSHRSPLMSRVRRIRSTSGVHVRESMSTRSAGGNMLLTGVNKPQIPSLCVVRQSALPD